MVLILKRCLVSPLIIISLIILLCLSTLNGCGGGGGNDGIVDIGWITIESSQLSVDTSGNAAATLAGMAFVSNDYVAHQCAGLACVFDWFDDSYPGVNVSWANLTTGSLGSALSRYGTGTDWNHLWSASVPVVAGINQLQVSAADPAGNNANAVVSVEYIPSAPSDLQANTGDGEITLLWSPVSGATAYRLYWALTPGSAYTLGTPIDLPGPPYLHTGLVNGTNNYYAITSRYLTSESVPSAEIAAIAGAPHQPQNPAATLINTDIELTWESVASADSYILYWSNEAGVDKLNSTPIPGVTSPHLHTGLSGLPYHYVVSAVNGFGESLASEEVMAFVPIAPPAPLDLTASQRSGLQVVDLVWQSVSGVSSYDVYRCWAWATSSAGSCEPSPNNCLGPWEHIGMSLPYSYFVDWTVDTLAYWYYVTVTNPYGNSPPSEEAGLCVVP